MQELPWGRFQDATSKIFAVVWETFSCSVNKSQSDRETVLEMHAYLCHWVADCLISSRSRDKNRMSRATTRVGARSVRQTRSKRQASKRDWWKLTMRLKTKEENNWYTNKISISFLTRCTSSVLICDSDQSVQFVGIDHFGSGVVVQWWSTMFERAYGPLL